MACAREGGSLRRFTMTLDAQKPPQLGEGFCVFRLGWFEPPEVPAFAGTQIIAAT